MIKTTIWSPAHVAAIADKPLPAAPIIDVRSVQQLLPGTDLWDLWPVQTPTGGIAEVAGGALVMLLAAPAASDPEARHAAARIRLMHWDSNGGTRDLGHLLPNGLAPGSREWAGSAVLDADGTLTLYFTAAGRRGEPVLSFEQRLFACEAHLRIAGGEIKLSKWTAPAECVSPDGTIYAKDMTGGGVVGTIKAFRDPGFFRDPSDGRDYLLFTGSLASSSSQWNGAIGVAAAEPEGGYTLLPPLVSADGLNNELERPHVVVHDGHYYLFWSTQHKVFADGGPKGPTGLYGMVADGFAGPWRPMNGTGLVLANPPEAPYQAFSWLVTRELDVFSFVDMPGLTALPANNAEARAHFGGTPAPILHIELRGHCSRVVE